MFPKITDSVRPFTVTECNAETYRLLNFLWLVFEGHAGNKIDEVWQQIFRTGVVGTGRNFAGS